MKCSGNSSRQLGVLRLQLCGFRASDLRHMFNEHSNADVNARGSIVPFSKHWAKLLHILADLLHAMYHGRAVEYWSRSLTQAHTGMNNTKALRIFSGKALVRLGAEWYTQARAVLCATRLFRDTSRNSNCRNSSLLWQKGIGYLPVIPHRHTCAPHNFILRYMSKLYPPIRAKDSSHVCMFSLDKLRSIDRNEEVPTMAQYAICYGAKLCGPIRSAVPAFSS